MFARVRIRNFQSLRDVDLRLGRLTVIVGPSSAGKSAFIRALRTLASNSRGASFVSHGARAVSVSVSTDTGATVTFERSGSATTYRVAVQGQEEKVFSKLGGAVPDLVTEVLRVAPVLDGSSVNFAGQFDRPYLLDDSGAQVARTLGELTNVNVLFEAAREANRLKTQASTALRDREAQLVVLSDQAQAYRNLPEQLSRVMHAEELLVEAGRVDTQASDLRGRLEDLVLGEVVLAQSTVNVGAVPSVDLTKLEEVMLRAKALGAVLQQLEAASDRVTALDRTLAEAEQQEIESNVEFVKAMIELGNCPVCGARSEHMHLDDLVSSRR